MKTKLIPIIFYTLCVLLLYAGTTLAQTGVCGTVTTKAYMEADIAQSQQQQQRGLFYPNQCLGKTLSITAYIVKDSTGAPGLTVGAIQAAIQTLNNDFAPICLSFELCQTIFIDNFNYNTFEYDKHDAEIRVLYYIPKTINMYFVQSLKGPSGAMVAGYASMPGGPDYMVITKSSTSSVKTIPHEMGHFFGLYHTFEIASGVEAINGSNCTTAGDLICDTPADNDPTGQNVAPDCQPSPYQQDAGGNWYVPQIGNLMSYYPESCNCGFTTQQYNRMAQQFLTVRNYLW